MVKAVFFDWFNTLARYEPPREQLQSQVLQEFGIHVSPQKIMSGLLIADRDILEENAVFPVQKRSPEEQAKIYTRYQETILTEAGINVSGEPDILVKIMKRVQQLSQGMTFALFNDVLSTLKTLKEQNLTLGLLTNLDKDMKPICLSWAWNPTLALLSPPQRSGLTSLSPPFFWLLYSKQG